MAIDQWYVKTQIGRQCDPEASKSQTCRNKENLWKKDETHKPAEKIATSANGSEIPERTRMKTPTALQTTGKNSTSRMECEIKIGGAEAAQADCSPDSQTGERTPNCAVKKTDDKPQVEARHGSKTRNVSSNESRNRTRIRGKLKFVQRGMQGIRGQEKQIDRSA